MKFDEQFAEFKTDLLAEYEEIKDEVKQVQFRMECGYDYSKNTEIYDLQFSFLDEDGGDVSMIMISRTEEDDTDAVNFAEEARDKLKELLKEDVEILDEIEYVSE
ncbi:hypothetical protein ACQKDB_16495 [Planococcus kocurii]|uniref:hypothetical protein n=1 Tax=Planococcus kocurii TaxID=1374 RepID=UPI003D05741C